jgi:hypothetical protein
MLLRPGFTDALRASESAAAAYQVIDATERELIG